MAGNRPEPTPPLGGFITLARWAPRTAKPGVSSFDTDAYAGLVYANDDGDVVGVVMRRKHGPWGLSIAVRSDHRMRGIGSTLMSAAEREWGRIDIDSLVSNPDSRAAVLAWDRAGRKPKTED